MLDSRPYQPLLDAYLRDRLGDPGIDRRVAAADPLLRYLERLHFEQRGRALIDYFRGGWSAHRLLRQLLRMRFGEGAAGASILDFGSGYGRTTRFLLREHPRDRITVADVMADAVDFQGESFGVRGFVSTPDPASLGIEGRFDVVIAISVFTHFNPDDFPAWLGRLLALVAPGGLLVFTVNDASLMLPGRSLDAAGACFEPASENERLDPRRYGSTWVSEAFVARSLAAAAAGAPEHRRIPRGLWASQDVYVVAVGGASLPQPLPFAHEPAGRLEAAAVTETGALALRGWAVMPDGAPVATVSAWIDGRPAGSTVPDQPRDDVAARFGPAAEAAGARAAAAAAGWAIVLEPPPGGGFTLGATLTVVATGRAIAGDGGGAGDPGAGVDFTLEHSPLTDTLSFLRTEALHQRIAALEHEVRRRDLEIGRHKEIQGALWWGARNRHLELKALKSELALSRFWKLRNRWWAVKRRLRPDSPR